MRKRMPQATALLVALTSLGLLGVLGVWYFATNEQQRYENALLGKTLDQVDAIMESGPKMYLTRMQLLGRGQRADWDPGEEAVGHWSTGRPGSEDDVAVVFDGAGTAVKVVFRSSFSSWLAWKKMDLGF